MPDNPVKAVLVVDDEKAVLLALRRVLGRRVEVAAADNALDALKELASGKYQAMIADYRMPEYDGIWLMRKAAERFPDVYRVLISGRQIDAGEELVEDGVIHRFAQKPIEIHELLGFLGLNRSSHDDR